MNNDQPMTAEETNRFLREWAERLNAQFATVGYIAEEFLGPLKEDEVLAACEMILRDQFGWDGEKLATFQMLSIGEKRATMELLFDRPA